jgi:hypothetical protein
MSFLFWALVYGGACILGDWALNRHRNTGPPPMNDSIQPPLRKRLRRARP